MESQRKMLYYSDKNRPLISFPRLIKTMIKFLNDKSSIQSSELFNKIEKKISKETDINDAIWIPIKYNMLPLNVALEWGFLVYTTLARISKEANVYCYPSFNLSTYFKKIANSKSFDKAVHESVWEYYACEIYTNVDYNDFSDTERGEIKKLCKPTIRFNPENSEVYKSSSSSDDDSGNSEECTTDDAISLSQENKKGEYIPLIKKEKISTDTPSDISTGNLIAII